MTIIHRIVFPEPDICDSEGLFFRTARDTSETSLDSRDHTRGIQLGGGASVTFDTYFNALSLEKWNALCGLESLQLSVVIDGDVRASIIEKSLQEGEIREKEIWQDSLRSVEPLEQRIDLDPSGARGVWCLSLQAGPGGATLHQGHFEAESAQSREINLAAVMCTYRREEFVQKNLEILTARIFENTSSSARGHLKLFVVDNAESLVFSSLPADVEVIRNPNTGGAGGFTRGLMRAQQVNRTAEQSFTHCLFLDDDINLHPESIERLIALLRHLKPEHTTAFINGAMLKVHDPTLQQEKRASWTGTIPVPVKKNLRLTELKDILINEYEPEPKSSYVPWWFCCFPMQVADEYLPFPFFVRGDDIEFSLRHSPQVLSLNGICVWHEAFERKPGEFMRFYFNARNYLVIRCVRADQAPSSTRIAYELVRDVLSQLLRMNYVTPRLLLRAHRDFLDGTRFFRESSPQSILADVTSDAEKWISIGSGGEEPFFEKEASAVRPRRGRFHKLLALITFNGHLLPNVVLADRGLLLERIGAKGHPGYLACKTLVTYDRFAELHSERSISRRKFASIFLETLRTAVAVIFRFGGVSKDFRTNFDSLTTEDFWKGYLRLNSESQD